MNSKICWKRIFSLTAKIIFFFVPICLFCYLVQRLDDVETTPNYQPQKVEVKLLPQIKLSNSDDCADIVVVSFCSGSNCEHHLESFHVLCKEVAGED